MRYSGKTICVTLVLLLFTAGFFLLQLIRSEETQPVSGQTAVKKTIILDPGHGGEDGGTTGCSGIQEADLNLQISLRLKDLLQLLGYSPVLTRQEDAPVGEITGHTVRERKIKDLQNRAAVINGIPDAVLVSIHQNYFSEGKYSGAQVFFAKTDGSRQIAETMQNALRHIADPTNHRKAKASEGVYLMEHISCPAVILECGFLSNYAEEQRLITPEYQQKIAAAAAAAILSFLQGGMT